MVLDDANLRLYRGDNRQIEFLEEFAITPAHVPVRVFIGETSHVAHRQVQGLKSLAHRLAQSPHLANMPVVVTGDPATAAIFARHCDHGGGVIRWEATEVVSMTCPQLLRASHAILDRVLDVYGQRFAERLRRFARMGRVVTDHSLLKRHLGEGNVEYLWLREDSHTAHQWHARAQGVAEKIQLVPGAFLAPGVDVVGLLRGESVATASLFKLGS